jgi:hypothetical protein
VGGAHTFDLLRVDSKVDVDRSQRSAVTFARIHAVRPCSLLVGGCIESDRERKGKERERGDWKRERKGCLFVQQRLFLLYLFNVRCNHDI